MKPVEEILAFTIAQLRTTFNSEAKEIVVPFMIEYGEPDVIGNCSKRRRQEKTARTVGKKCQYFIDELRSKERLKLGVKNADKYNVLLQIKKIFN